MKEEQIQVWYATKRHDTYSSYVGEVSPAPPNLVRGRFHAKASNRLWLMDMSEFPTAEGKVYLRPLIDCHDGRIVAWTRSRTPDKAMTDRMLVEGIATLTPLELDQLRDPDNPRRHIIHSDRGGYYRGWDWIRIEEENRITRSMSRKGNSGDNAASEGFFGRMKTEMFDGIRWESMEDLESAIDDHMDFCNNRRIKMSLGGFTISEYRQQQAELSKKSS